MTGLGAAAATVAWPRGASAQSAPPHTAFVPARHDADAWFDKLPGKHRMILDATTATGVGEAISFAGNLFAGNATGYNLKDDELAMVICLRHSATLFAFTDPLWSKYGKQMATMTRYESRSGELPVANPHNSPPRSALSGLAKRGVHFIVCDMASRRLARALAGSGDGEAVYKEMAANMIANGRFVPAGVVGVTRAQEYGYSLLFVG